MTESQIFTLELIEDAIASFYEHAKFQRNALQLAIYEDINSKKVINGVLEDLCEYEKYDDENDREHFIENMVNEYDLDFGDNQMLCLQENIKSFIITTQRKANTLIYNIIYSLTDNEKSYPVQIEYLKLSNQKFKSFIADSKI